jgi:hypothetical protein
MTKASATRTAPDLAGTMISDGTALIFLQVPMSERRLLRNRHESAVGRGN